MRRGENRVQERIEIDDLYSSWSEKTIPESLSRINNKCIMRILKDLGGDHLENHSFPIDFIKCFYILSITPNTTVNKLCSG